MTNIYLELKGETEVIIEIYSIDGKLIASKNYGSLMGTYNFPVVMSQWDNGIYTARITTGNTIINKQIVKQ